MAKLKTKLEAAGITALQEAFHTQALTFLENNPVE